MKVQWARTTLPILGIFLFTQIPEVAARNCSALFIDGLSAGHQHFLDRAIPVIDRATRESRRETPIPHVEDAEIKRQLETDLSTLEKEEARSLARRMIDDLLDSDSALSKAVRPYLSRIQADETQFWHLYWSVYDPLVSSSTGYHEAVRIAERYIQNGTVLDAGAGTGIFTAQLEAIKQAKNRGRDSGLAYVLVDGSESGLNRAKLKFEALNKPQGQVDFQTLNLLHLEPGQFGERRFSAIVVSNVFHTISEKSQKTELLGKLRNLLTNDGVIIFMDIRKETTEMDTLKRVALELANDSIETGVSMTGFELAVEVVLNVDGLLKPERRNSMFDRDSLTAFVEESGMEIAHFEPNVHAGASYLAVLRVANR